MVGGRSGYNASERTWRLPDRRIEFGSAPHPGDERRHQGRPKDLLVLDEAAAFTEAQARFLMGWVRSTRAHQRCRTLLTFNLPANAQGRWVVDFFAPWLDPAHPNPAAPGELRWFANVDGKDVEVDAPDFGDSLQCPPITITAAEASPEGDTVNCHRSRPQSRTFIPSRLADSPHLAKTGYRATLQAMPEPLRSQMLDGDFSAGLEDDRWQVIPTDWVEGAMQRWEPGCFKPMDSMGVDVARGGRDKTVIARRHGVWFDELLCIDGPQTPDGPTVAGQVMARRDDNAVVHIDVVGWGSSPFDVLKSNGIHTEPINGASAAKGRTEGAGLTFVNRRAELWWRMREALSPNAEAPLSLPRDAALKADLTAPRWKQTPSGIQIEAKEDMIKRLGRSPDRGDAVCMALIATPKLRPEPRRPRPMSGTWMG